MTDSPKSPVSRFQPWKVTWTGFFCLLAWTRVDSPWILVLASLCVASSAARGVRGRRHATAIVLLGIGVVVGFHADAAIRRISTDWESYWEEQRAAVAERVGVEFDALAAEGGEAVARISAAAHEGSVSPGLQDSLRAILRETEMAAVAVFGQDGRLVAWEGSHHGRFPEEVVTGASRYAYSGTPLFSYLYFTAGVSGDQGTAVAASLMRSDLPVPFASGLDDFASRFADQSRERIRIERSDRASGPGVLDLGWPDETLLSVTIVSPDPSERRSEVRTLWVRGVVVPTALAWLLLSFSAARGRIAYAVGGLGAAAFLLPLDSFLATPEFSTLAALRLDGPLPLALGRILLICAAAAPVVILAVPRSSPRAGGWILPLAVAVSFPMVLSWLGDFAPLEGLGSTELRWIVLQLAATLILTLVAGTALLFRNTGNSSAGSGLAAAGMAVAAGLGIAVAAGVRIAPHVSPGLVLLWALPAALIGRGVETGSRVSYARWFCAFWLAATAVLPLSWSMRTEARMAIAEEQLGELGIPPEPEVHALLDLFADRADSLHRAGASAVEMMYHSWVSSGLSAQGSPIFLTLWSAEGSSRQEMRLGVKGDLPPVVGELLPEVRVAGRREYHLLGEVDVHHLIAVPLSDGQVVTATIPPRRAIAGPPGLGPLFAAVEEGGDQEFLTLVRSPEENPENSGRVEWSRNAEGWMGESSALYPDGRYSVSYTISIPNPSVMFARATLVLVLDLVVISLLWLLSVCILGFRFSVPINRRDLFTSFRARVTWTLFGFFILSNVVFGTLAYRALAGASERTAAALAERVVAQIGEAYREEGGSMESLARRVGANVLEYRRGELAGGSVGELIELGLYESWVDPEIYAALETGRQRGASKVANLGDWQYVLAYRRLPDGNIVASPIPLKAGAAALRRRDVADLLGVAIVLGPILSLALALIVGRALARPIQTLQVASERVGRGNLAVHLAEDRLDEFGAVFAAFNRMVLRLGEARSELLRTTRRTQAIVEEVATGVIAVDKEGRVTVANPEAESLLGTPLETGAPIPRGGNRGAELVGWLESCRESGASESDANFRWADRRIRARARRIVRESHAGGVVVSLEDATDELRGERILAWGEMAKQVAHEVKNPLTPIKLSVQHLRRAWNDRRSDFGKILERNVATVLGEIDRLASIASSFSRLASPAAENAENKRPIESVDAAMVVREVLDLYEGGAHASIRLTGGAADGLPPVACRHDELKQVLLNLVENSRAAMPGGGVVRILVAEPRDGSGDVVITVADEGTGIPPDLVPRIFEPRFSTRSRGAGLGLAIVKRLVDSWDGTVDAESRVGRGTTVSIRLRRWVGPDRGR